MVADLPNAFEMATVLRKEICVKIYHAKSSARLRACEITCSAESFVSDRLIVSATCEWMMLAHNQHATERSLFSWATMYSILCPQI